MPVDSGHKTQLRVVPSAPGHIKDPLRPTQRGSLLPHVITPTKLADTSYNTLESLLVNKQYAFLKEKVSWCVGFVSDPVNCILNVDQLLVELCTSLYPEYRFLDLTRVFQTWSVYIYINVVCLLVFNVIMYMFLTLGNLCSKNLVQTLTYLCVNIHIKYSFPFFGSHNWNFGTLKYTQNNLFMGIVVTPVGRKLKCYKYFSSFSNVALVLLEVLFLLLKYPFVAEEGDVWEIQLLHFISV